MAPFSGAPSHAQQVTLALAPKFASFLSILGSCYILTDIFRRTRKSKRTPFHRLMTGLSIGDILLSIGLFTSTWPMPTDTPDVYGARGCTASCAFIGLIEQAGVSAVLYNGSLSVNYCLRIRHGWTEGRVAQKAEMMLHVIPITVGVTTMIAGLPLKLYNSGVFDCWIAPYPQGCQESWRSSDGSTTCERGDNASLYQWVFDLVPKFSAIILVTINMLLIFHSVWSTEQQSISRSFSGGEGSTGRKRRALTRQLAVQSALYVGALYLTYLPVALTRAFELSKGFVHYEMLLLISISIPLQGFWNALVYLRPRWAKVREEFRHRRFASVRAISCALAQGALDDDLDDGSDEEQPAFSSGAPVESAAVVSGTSMNVLVGGKKEVSSNSKSPSEGSRLSP